MEITRRDFVKLLAVAGGIGLTDPRRALAAMTPERLLDFEAYGNVTLLHITDSHATLLPVHFREPDTLLGIGAEKGEPPFLTGQTFLDHYGIKRGSAAAYAMAHLDFAELAKRYGRMAATPTLPRWSSRCAPSGPVGRCCSTAATPCRARPHRYGPMPKTWCRRSTNSG